MRPTRAAQIAAITTIVFVAGGTSATASGVERQGVVGADAAHSPFASEHSLTNQEGALARALSARAFAGPTSATKVRGMVRRLAPSLVDARSVVPAPSDVSRVLGPTAVQLKPAGSSSGRVSVSNLPIAVREAGAAGGWRLADLGWRRSQGRFETVRAAVDVSLPSTAGGIASVGPFRFRLAPRAASAPGTVLDETVIYPESTEDVDLVVRSLPVGVDVGWLIRSPRAATQLTVPIEGGARATVDERGAVTVRNAAGSVVGVVSPAKAIDSAGNRVPVKVEASGSEITIDVEHEAGTTQYPVMVDPVFEADWDQTQDFDGWQEARSSPTAPFDFHALPALGLNPLSGLSVIAQNEVTTAGTWAAWALPAPGDQSVGTPASSGRRVSPEHAYWTAAEVHGVDYQRYHVLDQTPPTGYLAFATPDAGWSDWSSMDQTHTPAWSAKASGPWTFTAEDYMQSGVIEAESAVPGNVFVTGLRSTGDSAPATETYSPDYQSIINVGGVRLTATDDVAPTVERRTAAPGWLDGREPLRLAAVDRGTGVASIALTGYLPMPPAGDSTPPSCPGTAEVICAFEADADFDVAALPEGRHSYGAVAEDAAGNVGQLNDMEVAVDRSAPALSIAGSLYTLRGDELLPNAERTLTVSATDGAPGGPPSAQRSGVERLEVYVDGELAKTEEQTTTGDSAPLATSWTLSSDTLVPGVHVVEVVAVDRAGNRGTDSFEVEKVSGASVVTRNLPGRTVVGDPVAALETTGVVRGSGRSPGSAPLAPSSGSGGTLQDLAPIRVTKTVPASGSVLIGTIVPPSGSSAPLDLTEPSSDPDSDELDGDCAMWDEFGGFTETGCAYASPDFAKETASSSIVLAPESLSTGVHAVTAGRAIVTRVGGDVTTAPTTIDEDGEIRVAVPDPSSAERVEVSVGTVGIAGAAGNQSYSARGETLQGATLHVVNGIAAGEPGSEDYPGAPCIYDESALPGERLEGVTLREIARDDSTCRQLVEVGRRVSMTASAPLARASSTGSRELTVFGRYQDFVNINLAGFKTTIGWRWNRGRVQRPMTFSDQSVRFLGTGWTHAKNHRTVRTRPYTAYEAYGSSYGQFTGGRPFCNNVPINVTIYANGLFGGGNGGYRTNSRRAGINPPACFKLLKFSLDVY